MTQQESPNRVVPWPHWNHGEAKFTTLVLIGHIDSNGIAFDYSCSRIRHA